MTTAAQNLFAYIIHNTDFFGRFSARVDYVQLTFELTNVKDWFNHSIMGDLIMTKQQVAQQETSVIDSLFAGIEESHDKAGKLKAATKRYARNNTIAMAVGHDASKQDSLVVLSRLNPDRLIRANDVWFFGKRKITAVYISAKIYWDFAANKAITHNRVIVGIVKNEDGTTSAYELTSTLNLCTSVSAGQRHYETKSDQTLIDKIHKAVESVSTDRQRFTVDTRNFSNSLGRDFAKNVWAKLRKQVSKSEIENNHESVKSENVSTSDNKWGIKRPQF
jgi:hypothetical protein